MLYMCTYKNLNFLVLSLQNFYFIELLVHSTNMTLVYELIWKYSRKVYMKKYIGIFMSSYGLDFQNFAQKKEP